MSDGMALDKYDHRIAANQVKFVVSVSGSLFVLTKSFLRLESAASKTTPDKELVDSFHSLVFLGLVDVLLS